MISKKNAGADTGPDRTVAPESDSGTWAVAGGGGVAGGLPHQSQRDRHAVAYQDLDGQARGDQDPPAVGLIEGVGIPHRVAEWRRGERGQCRQIGPVDQPMQMRF